MDMPFSSNTLKEPTASGHPSVELKTEGSSKVVPRGLPAAEADPGVFGRIPEQADDKLSNIGFFNRLDVIQDQHKIMGDIFNTADQRTRKHRYKIFFFEKGQIFR